MKHRLCAALLVLPLLLLSACNMSGDTLMLDQYPLSALRRTYESIGRGDIDITFPNTETLPRLQARILNSPGNLAKVINTYIYNESTYDIRVFGYSWFSSEGTEYKGLYYNTEKKVSNSTYIIRIDEKMNGYFLYELMTDDPIYISEDALIFFFFQYEDTKYIGGTDFDGNFRCWPEDQTLFG